MCYGEVIWTGWLTTPSSFSSLWLLPPLQLYFVKMPATRSTMSMVSMRMAMMMLLVLEGSVRGRYLFLRDARDNTDQLVFHLLHTKQ